MLARSSLRWILLFLQFLCVVPGAQADEIPEDYEMGEESVSPDGRFAILYPHRSATLTNGESPRNLLVRLQPYTVLSKVGSIGLPLGVTTSLDVEWSGNALLAVSESRKWGLLDLWVYELAKDGAVKRIHPVGREARQIFEKDIRARLLKKYPKESAYFALLSSENYQPKGPDFVFKGRTLHLHLAADNKPNLARGPHWTAQLRAIWNLDTGKFEKVDFHPDPIEIRGEP